MDQAAKNAKLAAAAMKILEESGLHHNSLAYTIAAQTIEAYPKVRPGDQNRVTAAFELTIARLPVKDQRRPNAHVLAREHVSKAFRQARQMSLESASVPSLEATTEEMILVSA